MLPRLRSSDNYIEHLLRIDGGESSSSHSRQQQQQQLYATATNPRALFRNFVLFCVLYSVAHATVDGVLAFSAAELGASLGSDGSSSLYFFYTFSALLFAKPALRAFGAKRVVLLGLIGLLCYVTSFFIALTADDKNQPGTAFIFLLGASIGGIGAGFLWTAQGSYYCINARAYAFANNEQDSSVALANFASIFASAYLLLETLFKIFATVIYLAKDRSTSWKPIVFGVYVTAAFCAVVAFSLCVKNLTPRIHRPSTSRTMATVTTSLAHHRSGDSISISISQDEDLTLTLTEDPGDEDDSQRRESGGNSSVQSISFDDEPVLVNLQSEPRLSDSLMSSVILPPTLWEDVSAVGRALLRSRRLQLLMPYQISFGLSSGFVNSYMMAKVVAVYLGDGYIGLMSALATLTAVILSWPYARVATSAKHGKWYIMLFGGCCFVFGGLSVLLLTDEQMSSWPFLVCYFLVYGAARSAWESTNKAVVAEYFDADDKLKDSAFAAVYFMSGLAGAFGFFFYKFMDRTQLASINTIVPLVALICYHHSHTYVAGIAQENPRESSNHLDAESPITTTSRHSLRANVEN